MKTKFFIIICCILLLLSINLSSALAANPANINATVTIQNLSVNATGPIDFGIVVIGSATVSSAASTVTNDGNVTETYSLSLTNPAGWTAVQSTPSDEQYCLSAMFNTSQPASGTFTYADHALSVTSIACSATEFAGDQTGLSVPATQTRSLWLKFEAPSSTTVTTQQTIVVTITASAG
ncbi:MAG TPA: hypothetical protein VGB01_03155 [candidate division Zixibacteria bacterium]|jgi:hypothetical protein